MGNNTYQSVLRTSDDILFYFGYKVKELSNYKLICKRSRDCICILNANGLTIEQSFSVPKNITILGELNSNIILCQDNTTSYLLDIPSGLNLQLTFYPLYLLYYHTLPFLSKEALYCISY